MQKLVVAVLMVSLVAFTGCKSTMCVTGAPSEPEMKVITVTVDANQNFVVNDKTLTVEEFFAQAEFEERSKLVYLDVEAESAVTEETVIRAIRHLESRGYLVSMMDGSKFGHLNDICKK